LADDGWESLVKNIESYNDALTKNAKGTKAYTTALNNMTKDVKKIFGNSKAVTKDFVERNKALINDMANGVEGAAEDVEEAILRE
jgi:hypothetical protein